MQVNTGIRAFLRLQPTRFLQETTIISIGERTNTGVPRRTVPRRTLLMLVPAFQNCIEIMSEQALGNRRVNQKPVIEMIRAHEIGNN